MNDEREDVLQRWTRQMPKAEPPELGRSIKQPAPEFWSEIDARIRSAVL